MEVVVSKRLHLHVLPIAVFVLSLMALSVISLSGYASTGTHNDSVVARALFERVIYVEPTTNGLGKITLEDPEPAGVPGFSQAGTGANLTFSLEQ